MKERKLIAVATMEIVEEHQRDVIRGIIEQAYALDYNVAVFNLLMRDQTLSTDQTAEMNILNLINFEKVDGLIVADYDMSPTVDYYDDYMHTIKKISTVPLIAADSENPLFDHVSADDYELFKIIVNHIIEKHGARKIYCLTGGPDHFAAKHRTKAFIDTMKEHDIPIEDYYIYHGDFWIYTANAFAMKIVSGELPMPEAIVCESDNMAIEVINTLTDNGIRIPEDVIVSGFDGIDDAGENIPSVTTLTVSGKNIGMRTMCRMHEILTGEKSEPLDKETGTLAMGTSCNCVPDLEHFAQRHKLHLRKVFEDRLASYIFTRSNMAQKLTAAHDRDECINSIRLFTSLINGMEEYYLCLCSNWNSDNNYCINGYSQKMTTIISCNEDNYTNNYATFDSCDMFPRLWEDLPEPIALYFTPLHFNERCLGYSVLKMYGVNCPDDYYATWNKNVNNALEFVRIRERLSFANKRLYMMSIRDELTGIYNRNGYYHIAEPLLTEAKEQDKKLLMVSADVDGLKFVNDTYGHIEGDNIISAAANVLNAVCGRLEICARCGGDEFIIIGCDNYADDITEKIVADIRKEIKSYNVSSNKPYQLDISVGALCVKPVESTTLRELTQQSDLLMYANKATHKNSRSNHIE